MSADSLSVPARAFAGNRDKLTRVVGGVQGVIEDALGALPPSEIVHVDSIGRTLR